jgi:hypothetical protein
MTDTFDELLRREIDAGVRECMNADDDLIWRLVDTFQPSPQSRWRRWVNRQSSRLDRVRQAWCVLRGTKEVHDYDD